MSVVGGGRCGYTIFVLSDLSTHLYTQMHLYIHSKLHVNIYTYGPSDHPDRSAICTSTRDSTHAAPLPRHTPPPYTPHHCKLFTNKRDISMLFPSPPTTVKDTGELLYSQPRWRTEIWKKTTDIWENPPPTLPPCAPHRYHQTDL